jgi:hypothetical protein
MQAVQTATTSAQHANTVAHDVAASKSAKEARTKLWVVLRQIDSSAWFAKTARAMVRVHDISVLQTNIIAPGEMPWWLVCLHNTLQPLVAHQMTLICTGLHLLPQPVL